ncbi:MAG: aldo/keto reductase, partial [Candidatus Cloacimonetes bacterium]|nr:aldo/keto reductase [Candidatus Cloacimonadota bacterium]
MKYRKFGTKIKFKPSALGYGMMRLPMKEDGTIDVKEAVKIVRHAIDNGVNYIDTAYMYHGGESEKVVAKVLKDGYREKVKIADKMPLWSVKEEGDLDKIFFDQLKKLEVKKIDFYLLHALNKDSLKIIKKFNVIKWLEKKKTDGYIEHFGFSAHDSRAGIKKILDYYDWDFCMFQFNIIDKNRQAGIAGVKYAAEKGMGVIVMEPLRGGQLTVSIPKNIQLLWDEMAALNGDKVATPSRYLLDWVWNFPEVSFLISGMSSMEQVKENLASAN